MTNATGSTLLGIGLGLVAGGTYATYSWAVHRLMTRGIGWAAAMGSVFGGGGALLLPVLIVTSVPLIGSTDYLLVAGYMALVPMFAGYVLFGFGLTRVPASTATTITLTEPAIATILAVIIVGEHLTGIGWAGLATIGLVLAVLALAPTNTPRADTTSPTPPDAARSLPLRPGVVDETAPTAPSDGTWPGLSTAKEILR